MGPTRNCKQLKVKVKVKVKVDAIERMRCAVKCCQPIWPI
jgi:hypothetical protein